jgi:hypothetical protein
VKFKQYDGKGSGNARPVPVLRFTTSAVTVRGGRIPAVRPRHRQLLLDTGRALMMLAAVVLTHLLGTTAVASEHLPIALLLWLIGTALTMTSLVARQFPTLAAAGVNVARVLRNYVCESP